MIVSMLTDDYLLVTICGCQKNSMVMTDDMNSYLGQSWMGSLIL